MLRQNRGGRQKLLKLILAGLLLGGFAAPAYAADQTEETGPAIQFHGYANGYGNPDFTADPNASNPWIPTEGPATEEPSKGIDVAMYEDGKISHDTTSAVIFSKKGAEYGIIGDVRVVNTFMNGVNNDAIYAINGTTVEIGDEESNVYLASIGNVEKETVFGNGSSVLAAKGGGGNNHITVSGKTVQLIGNLDFLGLSFDNSIKANLQGKDSFWYGDESNPYGVFGTLDVTLSDGAEWIYNDTPFISALTLDGGIVNLQDDDIQKKYEGTQIESKTPDRDEDGDIKTDPVTGETIMKDVTYILSDYRSDSPHTYVDIGTLHGSGIFKADIDWIANQGRPESTTITTEDGKKHFSDYINIDKFEDDSAQTSFPDNEKMPIQTLSFDASKAHLEDMKAGDKLYFAYVGEGNTSFKTEYSVYSNAANVFNYKYGAFKDTDEHLNNWYIGVTGKTAEDNANFTAARALMDAGYAMGTEMDTLNKRMGEARYLDSDQGLWVRYRHGRSSRDDSYKTDSDMIQLGYDRKNDAESGTHHRGVAFDYTDADTSLYQLSGSGDVDRYALSLYDTWMGNKGHYYDFVIRGGRINSGYDISGRFSTGMESMDNSYHQWFGSVSFEYGRKKDMSGSWYIEPQAQLQLARIGGASFTSASGVRTELDGTTSLIGRAGFRLGWEFGSDGSDRNTFYIKADILHEFAGDRGFTLTGNDGWYAQNDNGTDTWYDVGIGVDLSLGHSTYFWTDVERILGSDFDNTWQVSGGLRWKW